MNKIALFIKTKRKEAGLTQEEFAMRSGLGLRFVRELEQGKETVRMDKVNTALAMFNMEAVPGRKEGRPVSYTHLRAHETKADSDGTQNGLCLCQKYFCRTALRK